jgi:cyanophycinase-like exopeptidase
MSRLSLQERELEPGDNAFIIHSRSNHNYENFTVGSYQVGLGQVSSHLVSGHFGSRVVSGRVGSGIGSSSDSSFRVLGRIRSCWVGYRFI